MKYVLWFFVFTICTHSFHARAADEVNNPKLSKLLASGSLREGMICGVECVLAKGMRAVKNTRGKQDGPERRVADAIAWYNFANAYRMLSAAHSDEGVNASEKKRLDAKIQEVHSILMTIGQGMGWSAERVDAEFAKTDEYYAKLIEESEKQ